MLFFKHFHGRNSEKKNFFIKQELYIPKETTGEK